MEYFITGNKAFVFGEYDSDEHLLGCMTDDMKFALELKRVHTIVYGEDFRNALGVEELKVDGLGNMPEEDEDALPW